MQSDFTIDQPAAKTKEPFCPMTLLGLADGSRLMKTLSIQRPLPSMEILTFATAACRLSYPWSSSLRRAKLTSLFDLRTISGCRSRKQCIRNQEPIHVDMDLVAIRCDASIPQRGEYRLELVEVRAIADLAVRIKFDQGKINDFLQHFPSSMQHLHVVALSVDLQKPNRVDAIACAKAVYGLDATQLDFRRDAETFGIRRVFAKA